MAAGTRNLAWLAVGWVLASAASGSVGGLMFEVNKLVGAASFGAIFGAAQWLVLRRYLPGAYLWVLFTGLGVVLAWPVGALSTIVVFSMTRDAPALRSILQFAPFVAAGLTVGMVQLAALCGRVLHPVWWPPASALGGIFVSPAMVGLVGAGVRLDGQPIPEWLAGLSGGLGYGLVTAIPLAWLLAHRVEPR